MTAAAPAMPPIARTTSRVRDIRELPLIFTPGERVFLPGSAAEITPLMEALCAPGAPPLALTTSFVPGINPLPMAGLPMGTTIAGVFSQPGTGEAQRAGRFAHLALSYSEFLHHLRERLDFDTCILHVAPPDGNGRCSLGVAVEFSHAAARKAGRVAAVINPRMPRMPEADSIAFDDIDIAVECDAPLREYDVGAPTEQARAIAGHVAAFIEDGAALQIGLGKVPDTLLRVLTDRRGLRLQSGMLSDGARLLSEAGALDRNWLHAGCVHVGSAGYYQWLDGRRDFATQGCDRTHDVGRLAAVERLVAVNSALTVDLFGQANLEMLDGRMISGCGGAPDFARGASLSPGGVSIVALPSTSARGDVSRITPQLDGVCSIPRNDIGVVVTEHGAADLRGLGAVERAERLISIAAPQHRAFLSETFGKIAARF